MGPLILHIETSSRTCSVALSAGPQVISVQMTEEPFGHSEFLAPLIREILTAEQLKARDLDAVSISIGPGSYTGLRVGLSTAKALCQAAGCHLITVSTLESLTRGADMLNKNPLQRLIPVLDARRQDAYMAIFSGHGGRLQEDRCITVTADCLDAWIGQDEIVIICGECTEKWQQHFGHRISFSFVPVECHAANLVGCAWRSFEKQEFANIADSIPKYLKPPNITSKPVNR